MNSTLPTGTVTFLFTEAESIQAIARMCLVQGSLEQASQLFTAVGRLRESISHAMTIPEQIESERELGNLRSELGVEAFNKAWNAGCEMALDQVIQLALS